VDAASFDIGQALGQPRIEPALLRAREFFGCSLGDDLGGFENDFLFMIGHLDVSPSARPISSRMELGIVSWPFF